MSNNTWSFLSGEGLKEAAMQGCMQVRKKPPKMAMAQTIDSSAA